MLEGRLDDLSLPDLFQLLALTNKTGTLRVRYGDTAGAVIFREGQIVGAFDDVRRTAPGTRMLAAGLLDDAQLEAALDATEHQDEGGVIAALVAQGAIDETTVAEFRRQQAEDAVFALMRLSEATFSLETGEVPPLAGEVELNTEQLVVEGGRRLSEWAEIRRRVPGRQSVPSLVPDPPGEGPVTVGRQQWRLLALVDGRRTVGDLVDLLGSGEYATSAELSGLVDAGLISVGDRASHVTGVRSRGERLRELETRELGLLRDDPAETPETVAADLSAPDDADHEDGEDDAAAAADDGEVVVADDGDASGDGADADADDEAGDGAADAGEPADEASRPIPRPSRTTLAPTLISGIELGDDVLTAGEPSNGDDGASGEDAPESDAEDAAHPAAPAEGVEAATVPDAADVAAEALGSAEASEREEDEDGEPAASDDGDEPEEVDEPAGGPDPLPAAPPQPATGESASAPAEKPASAQLPAAPGTSSTGQSNGNTVWVDDEEETEKPPQRRLTRDEDINKAMLLRLIDGVKGV